MSRIELTAEPVRGYSGTVHFAVPNESGLRVSRVRANTFGDERRFITVEFIDHGLEFILDKIDVPEGWKDEPDVGVLREQIVLAICERMNPKAFGDILTVIRTMMARAEQYGMEAVRKSLRGMLGVD